MGQRASDLHLQLDPESSEKLARLADAEGTTQAAIAERLLCAAINSAEISPESIERMIDATPGLYERLQKSRAQGRTGTTISLSELRQT